MRVLVTGASGFLGSHVAEQLRSRGHATRALVRASSKTATLESLGVELTQASLETGDGLDAAMKDVDAVVHCAGLVKARSPEEFRMVNTVGTQNLLNAALARGRSVKRFVFVSSLAAHGPSSDGTPRSLDAEPSPVTHYGRSKLEGERAVLAASDKLNVTVIRPPAIYGPRDTEMFAFFQSVKRRIVPLIGRGNTASLIYGPDCASAIYAALTKDHPSGKSYFVDDGRIYSWEEMGQILQEALGVRALHLRMPVGLFSTVALGTELYGKVRNRAVMLTRDKVNELRQQHWVCNAAELRRDLEWSPEVDFRKGAKITADWYRSQGWL